MQLNEKFTLSRQTTRRYNAAWSHLDESEDVGMARAIISKDWGKHDPHGESRRTLIILCVSSQSDEEEVREAIEDTLQYSCRCEHDCCGHWQHSISKARRLRSGMWAIIQSSYRNV
jgi:hypothetical protein